MEQQLTIISAYEQFWEALEDNDRRSLTSTGQVYGYLVHIWNGCGRPALFRRQNTLICAELCVSKPTLDRHRQILKNAGLIDFFSKGKGDQNITYSILDYRSSKKNLLPEVKKEKNFTTPVTSPVTTPDDIKQSKSSELFVEVDAEVKNFYYLRDLFTADEGILRRWADQGFPGDKFEKGLEYFFQRNHGHVYPSFRELRGHLFNWIPAYAYEIQNNQKITNGHRKTNGQNHAHQPIVTGTAESSGEL